MTADEARENVAEMMRRTKRDARQHLWRVAIERGNLSDEARDVYRDALASDS